MSGFRAFVNLFTYLFNSLACFLLNLRAIDLLLFSFSVFVIFVLVQKFKFQCTTYCLKTTNPPFLSIDGSINVVCSFLCFICPPGQGALNCSDPWAYT